MFGAGAVAGMAQRRPAMRSGEKACHGCTTRYNKERLPLEPTLLSRANT